MLNSEKSEIKYYLELMRVQLLDPSLPLIFWMASEDDNGIFLNVNHVGQGELR
jgi:hypothetical protein